MGKGSTRDLDRISDDYYRRSRQITVTPEMEERTKRVVCGARSVEDAADASELLQALGLIPYSEAGDAEVSRYANA